MGHRCANGWGVRRVSPFSALSVWAKSLITSNEKPDPEHNPLRLHWNSLKVSHSKTHIQKVLCSSIPKPDFANFRRRIMMLDIEYSSFFSCEASKVNAIDPIHACDEGLRVRRRTLLTETKAKIQFTLKTEKLFDSWAYPFIFLSWFLPFFFRVSFLYGISSESSRGFGFRIAFVKFRERLICERIVMVDEEALRGK